MQQGGHRSEYGICLVVTRRQPPAIRRQALQPSHMPLEPFRRELAFGVASQVDMHEAEADRVAATTQSCRGGSTKYPANEMLLQQRRRRGCRSRRDEPSLIVVERSSVLTSTNCPSILGHDKGAACSVYRPLQYRAEAFAWLKSHPIDDGVPIGSPDVKL